MVHTKFFYFFKNELSITDKRIKKINMFYTKDLFRNKFQWLFNVYCAKKYRNIKEYYHLLYSNNPDMYPNFSIPLPPAVANMSPWEQTLEKKIDQDKLRHSILTWNASKSKYVLNRWIGNLFISSRIKYLLTLKYNRPLIIEEVGEAFDMPKISRIDGNDIDVNFQRCKSWGRYGCISIYFMEGATLPFHTINKRKSSELYHMWSNLSESLQKSRSSQIASKTRFCSFTVKWMLGTAHYFGDFLVRHVFFHLLNKQYHKKCEFLGQYKGVNPSHINHSHLCNVEQYPQYAREIASGKGYFVLPICQRPYKLLAGSVPIYFGNQIIEELVNPKRIIVCNISDEVIIDLRHQFGRLDRGMRWNEQEKLLQWGTEKLQQYLQPCINEVIALDQNDELYKQKIEQPILPNYPSFNSHYDGSAIATELANVLQLLQSTLFT
ncbi:hypothetical protein RFI_28728 [Reticulomyxa filosa]|uniref:Uncharacterized protein n=1 Tax=Reticulomyxa filosa TaxID=46433 RepID=X6M6K7_RETFI|nr:hypothetical protein RFI_28728 [Reticulomyxa filosa]|eukprot:ETO08660.1 hypothetical protein RFI_28728 [Reticulomyxa filosa]